MIEINKTYCGDALEVLKTFPDNFIDCCTTSPPYFGLRDYGVDGQIGLEKTPDEFVSKLVEVFTEVKRVLKDSGTAWLNLGDSYAGGTTGRNDIEKFGSNAGGNKNRKHTPGVKPKDLIGIPWMVAFALRNSGWYLRQDIIWHKPNPMPESVTDRCTKAHEYIFLLSKSAKYYYDAEAISEPAIHAGMVVTLGEKSLSKGTKNASNISGGGNANADSLIVADTKNKRSVWTVSGKPFPEAHFATFPPELIVDCIKAGCPLDGIVLDPFNGSGTTRIVAEKLGRNSIGIELNPKYIQIETRRRKKELGMFEKIAS